MANTRSSALPTTRKVKGLLGTKLGMTQVWDEQNKLVPVTVVATGNNVVTQIRDEETDGYPAVQIAFGEIDPRKVNKPTAGHFEKAGVTPRRHLVELRTADAGEYSLGQELGVDTFEAGVKVDVTAKTKGKGTAGVMKRHASPVSAPRTVLTAITASPVRSVERLRLVACSRACAWPAVWVPSSTPPRTSRSTPWTPRTTSCSSRAPFPAPRAPSFSFARPRRRPERYD